MAGKQAQGTRVIKVSYYLTLVAEVELELAEGEDEEQAIHEYLPDIPAHKCNVITADFAEIEDEEHGKRCIKLS